MGWHRDLASTPQTIPQDEDREKDNARYRGNGNEFFSIHSSPLRANNLFSY
jgi:hypothetical protein